MSGRRQRDYARDLGCLAGGEDGWRSLWPRLCGSALTAPRLPADAPGGPRVRALRMFSDISFPHEAALAEIGAITALITERSPDLPVPLPDSGPRATGAPMVARDEFRSRFVLAAPFGYGGPASGNH